MKFKIVCYNTITHRSIKTLKTGDFKEALDIFIKECSKGESFINVTLYKGFIKITSCFMGNDYYKVLETMLDDLKK